jgi:hypothetical protein
MMRIASCKCLKNPTARTCPQQSLAGEPTDRVVAKAEGSDTVRKPNGTVLDDHLASVLVVQTTMFGSPRRLAEALLLCRTQDGVLVRGASMG